MSAQGQALGVTDAKTFPGGGGIRYDHTALAALLTSEDGATGVMLARAGAQVERAAKRLCPVDTGRLRASITHVIERDHLGLCAVIGTNVTYAPHVEFGTVHTPAQPFLRPALTEIAGVA